MTSVIVLANIAGGTQKTTAAHSLAVAMVEYGKKVLLIDLDPRADSKCDAFERSNPSVGRINFLAFDYIRFVEMPPRTL